MCDDSLINTKVHRRGNDARAALEVPCRTADAPEESIPQPGSGENLRLSARVAYSLALVISTRGACTTVDPMCLIVLFYGRRNFTFVEILGGVSNFIEISTID